MMIVETANSSYEFDTVGKLVRRVGGTNEPTDRFREDGDWHRYEAITAPVLGQSMCINWPDGQPALRDNTVTSAVQSIFINVDELGVR